MILTTKRSFFAKRLLGAVSFSFQGSVFVRITGSCFSIWFERVVCFFFVCFGAFLFFFFGLASQFAEG